MAGIVSLNLGALARSTLAIPSENYYAHAAELLEHGRRTTRPARAWLGMFCYALPDRTVVAGLVPGGPGERSGLKVGDILVRIDGEQVTGRTQLYDCIWAHAPGEPVELHVYRESGRASRPDGGRDSGHRGELETIEIESTDAEDFFRSHT